MFCSVYCRRAGAVVGAYGNPVVFIRSLSSALGADKSRRNALLEDRCRFTVSYLVDSYGLPLESAQSISKRVSFDDPGKADSLRDFLKNHGFTVPQISRVIRAYPHILVTSTDCLLPKLQFLQSIGLSKADFGNIVSSNPKLLAYSLIDRLIPCYNFVKGLLAKDELLVELFRCSSQVLHLDVETVLAPKLSVLMELGVPKSSILQLLRRYSRMFSLRNEKFETNVKKVIALGFKPSSANFVQALKAFSHMKKSTWERKMEAYKRWGWSEVDVWSAFKRQPVCMSLSETKVNLAMDFLVNAVGIQSSVVARDPTILGYSLEKRIIPRYSVIKVLQSRHLISDDVVLASVVRLTDERFLDAFVVKHQDQVPELRDVFHRKGGFQK